MVSLGDSEVNERVKTFAKEIILNFNLLKFEESIIAQLKVLLYRKREELLVV